MSILCALSISYDGDDAVRSRHSASPPPGFKEGQRYNIAAGEQYLIFNAERTASGVFAVQRWHEVPGEAKRIELLNVRANSPLYLDTWQISYLERHGLIRPVALSGPAAGAGVALGSALCLTDRQSAAARRWQEYLDVVVRECNDLNDGILSRRLMETAVKRLAAERGEKPPGCRASTGSSKL